ncbi:protein-tyrosine phosphatase family protein [Amycolatopsis sp., V23-08]|uniref:Protein-tyrosine phosphatase family protein n=1 Tax=Amycolatopsis heterodermiae TaxID=3110235 RepID=A0ABU5R7N4_9PSEU|nr:protein-tyrosine phosphatase family protein [Amycolatopsis sp., V23-08]MEA5362247.1 protein-tyrosine phosphatase family protein [Amycolatopsis sp., V23-08]
MGSPTVEFPDGTRVRGRGLGRPRPDEPAPDFGLYLGTSRLRRKHGGGITWPHEWVTWPDFLLPAKPAEARRQIKALHARAKLETVEVACYGGAGRTGTVMACLAVLSGVPAGDAVAWVREHYNPRAVETPWQRGWVKRFADRLS